MISACNKGENMSRLPKNWKAGDYVGGELYGSPPKSDSSEFINIYGLGPNDTGHRIYTIPANTTLEEIITFFKVSTHGSESYSFDPNKTLKMFIEKTTKASKIIPGKVIFADSAGLKIELFKEITEDDILKLEKIFPEELVINSGMELVMSEWDGKGSYLSSLKGKKLIHYWWD